MSTSTLEHTVTETVELDEHGNPKQAHIVYPKGPLMDAIINQTPVTALCGYTWVPGRDPKKFPLCAKCKEAFEAIHGEIGDDVQ